MDVKNPSDPDSTIPNEDLESYPYIVETLSKEGFRAVQVDAGDSVSVAVSDRGELRVWGSFRVGHQSSLPSHAKEDRLHRSQLIK